jgi:hypothetical protein
LPKQVAGPGTVDNTEFGLAWNGQAVVAAAWAPVGFTAQSLYYWWNPPGTSNWVRQEVYSVPIYDGATTYAAIASTSGGLVIAATDTAGNLDYWWQLNGSTTWHQELVGASPGMFGYIQPAITSTGTGVVITAVDFSTGDLYYWWQPNGGTTWNKELVATSPVSNGSYFSPQIVWNGGGVLISAAFSTLSNSNALDFWWQAAGTTPWYQEQVASNTSGYGGAGIAWAGNAVHVVSVNYDDNSVDFWWEWAGGTTWNPETIS